MSVINDHELDSTRRTSPASGLGFGVQAKGNFDLPCRRLPGGRFCRSLLGTASEIRGRCPRGRVRKQGRVPRAWLPSSDRTAIRNVVSSEPKTETGESIEIEFIRVTGPTLKKARQQLLADFVFWFE